MFTLRGFSIPVVQGDFRLEPREVGWAIRPAAELSYGTWLDQGLSFYSGAVRYEYEFQSDKADGAFQLKLGDWRGTVVAVSVDDAPCGITG